MKHFFLRYSKRSVLVVTGIFVIALGGYFFGNNNTSTTSSAVVAHQVGTGVVSTGIQTTGKIVAADILDLNVYKLTNRIDEVHIANGTHVEAGQLLFAFDQSDVAVEIAESEIGIREAQLSLAVEREDATDPNTTLTSLEDDIAKLQNDLDEFENDTYTTLRTFLNKNLEAIPTKARYDVQVNETAPTIGGVYTSSAQGEYKIQVYSSNEDSGYSYHLSGLETGTYPVFLGVETKFGTRGLTITFPVSGVSNWDEWVVAVPNTYAPEYPENLDDYTKAITTLEESRKSNEVSLVNKKVLLSQTQRQDTSSKRELDVESAALAIEKARVNLQKGIETQNERRIIAPFSGTVEGMENVVVGASPTKDSNDSIDFGYLISDDFMTTFSLGANDVGKISVGQKVLVTLTSLPQSNALEAEIVEISSLPDSNAVAQYEVLARIQDTDISEMQLRDGMLADVEIVQEEKADVVRVPVSGVHYTDGKACVTVIEGLSEAQYMQMQTMGIVRSDGVPTYTTVERLVELGLRGQYYIEISSGLEPGEVLAVTTSTTSSADESVVQNSFGPPGSGRSRESTSDTASKPESE